MIVKRMVLEGEWAEAFLHFDFLWLFDEEGDIRAFDLAAFVEARLIGQADAARRLFARNDDLVRTDAWVRAQAQTPEVQRFLADGSLLHVSSKDIAEFSVPVATGGAIRRPLDVRMYNGHAFVSVPGGLSQFEAFGRDEASLAKSGPSNTTVTTRPRRMFGEGTPLQIQCGLGAITVSCGAEGLFGSVGIADEGPWRGRLAQVGGVSFGCEVARAGVSSLPDAAGLELRPVATVTATSQQKRGRGGDDRESLTIVGIEHAVDEEAAASFAGSVRIAAGTKASPTQTFLSSTSAYTLLTDGTMTRTPLGRGGQFLHEVVEAKVLAAPKGRVIGMTTTAGRMLAETHEGVQILAGDRWWPISDEPVLRVRGYPNSRWYKQLITMVARDRLELLFICDE